MATWHQSKHPVRRDPVQWCVITDPPGGFRTGIMFAAAQEALDWLARGGLPHSYLLPPVSDVTGLPTRFPRSWTKARQRAALATVGQLDDAWQAFRHYNPAHARRAFVAVRSRGGRVVATLHYGSDQGTSTVSVAYENGGY